MPRFGHLVDQQSTKPVSAAFSGPLPRRYLYPGRLYPSCTVKRVFILTWLVYQAIRCNTLVLKLKHRIQSLHESTSSAPLKVVLYECQSDLLAGVEVGIDSIILDFSSGSLAYVFSGSSFDHLVTLGFEMRGGAALQGPAPRACLSGGSSTMNKNLLSSCASCNTFYVLHKRAVTLTILNSSKRCVESQTSSLSSVRHLVKS